MTLIDANGKSATATSDANGNYSISIVGLTAPFLIIASDPSGVDAPMYSVTATAQTNTSAPLVANVTPLTTAVASELTADGNPLDLSSSPALVAQVTPAAVDAAVLTLNTILAPILTANGLTASAFNPISTAFTTNQAGPDAVIDSVSVTPSSSGALQLATVSAPSVAVTLTSSTPSTTQLAAPPVAAGYLAPLLTQLSQCLVGAAAGCSSAIDAHYLENGYSGTNGFESFHTTLSASGSVVTGASTLVYWPAGQSPFPNIIGTSALVRIFYTTAAGLHNFALTVVQLGPSGWTVIGNQQANDVSINSFVAQRKFADLADAAGSRDETGLDISITYGSGSVNPQNIGSVNVTGPGLPTGGVWLEPRSAAGSDTLALSSRALTNAPVASTSGSNTDLYRWSWQALPSDASNFQFSVGTGDSGYYAAAPLTGQMLPAPFATYTATFYSTSGAQIGSPTTVINSTPPLLADAAAGVAWPTVGSDVVNNFLSPAGAQAGAQGSAAIDWSGLVNGQNIAPLVTGVQIQAGTDTTSATPPEVDGWWKGVPSSQGGQYAETVVAGVAENGAQTCSTACSFPALVSGVSRLVQLSWGAQGVTYYGIVRYTD